MPVCGSHQAEVAFAIPIVTTNISPKTGMIQKILIASALILSIPERKMNRESGGLANRPQQKFILTNDGTKPTAFFNLSKSTLLSSLTSSFVGTVNFVIVIILKR